MHVVLAGASGLIGSALDRALEARGDRVTRLVRRRPSSPREVQWNPGGSRLNPMHLEGADAVISIGGASISKLPWTKKYRKKILESRIGTTRTIATAIHEMGADGPALLSGSAVGYYGSAPGREMDERSASGDTFLARVCVDWEEEARRVEDTTRVALLRTAMVLHPDGVLGPLNLLTKLGISGPIGSGNQIWPWICLEDEVGAILHVLDNEISGPVNLVAPEPASNREIGKELARQLRRPYAIPVPGVLLRGVVGKDAAESLLLADAKVKPAVLHSTGFEFCYPDVRGALKAALAPAE
ncbi:TIGR01777 family oxidoreductase [Actinomycetaceae bacterium L2_0104]